MLTKDNKSFCFHCLKDVDFMTHEEQDTGSVKDHAYSYMRLIARCIHCGEELDVYNDENIKRLYDSYRIAHDLISLDRLREIPVMYGIAKRTLSLMLGWGEITFTRYYDGYLPSKPYSDILQKLYDDPTYYNTLLENNRESLSASTYRKSKRALDDVMNSEFKGLSAIARAASHLLRKKPELSNLSLQKLLYYIQAISSVFLPKPIFPNLSEAWINGPVYRDIYNIYKENIESLAYYAGGEPLTEEEIALIGSVVDCFGCYDGDILKEFTHLEAPWQEARGNLTGDASSNERISLESIAKYFTKVKDQYQMTAPSDMKVYARHMFTRVCG